MAILTQKGYKPFKLNTKNEKSPIKRAYKLSEKKALIVPKSY
jgi:hypothetical protein